MPQYYYKLRNVILTILFVIIVFFCLPLVCGHSHDEHVHSHHGHGHAHNGHGHSHGHAHGHEEPPSFKWSREANSAFEDKENEHNSDQEDFARTKTHQADSNIWFEAFSATVLISLAPYLILFFIPITNSKEHKPYLKILLAFASGGLLGDAFLHLIPHALLAQGVEEGGHGHSHSHSHSEAEDGHHHTHNTSIGMSVLCGIITFLIVEKFVRIFKGGHSHSHGHQQVEQSDKNGKGKEKKTKTAKVETSSGGDMKVAGYLNLAADFTHNFTDGLAIGASFLAGKSVGLVTTFTIFLHEIPHEIGDFAILLQSGCSKKKAMMLQLITAVGALTGTWVSLMAEGTGDAAVSWILPFTAGGFIYIATVSVMPELLETTHFWQSVAEVTALTLGVALMMIITWFEELGGHV